MELRWQIIDENYCASSSWGYSGTVTGFENIENQSAAHKVLRNGQVGYPSRRKDL